ncbi:MAG: chemotaxis-specific protein-glutamate methyltransferase CheB [Calditrichaeota bacterium]|nr:MAG: chemotaxis-specific protein-glutamate methyltransferase CheB [Calditrichota bacterium]
MPSKKPLRVMIVEDSAVVQQLLFRIFSTDPDIYVAGMAGDGMEAIEMIPRAKPDVITMDIHMPRLDGLEATRRIMENYPIPVVIITASKNARDVNNSFKALSVGALAILEKPPGVGHPDFNKFAAQLIKTVKIMSEVKVVRRKMKRPQASPGAVKQDRRSERKVDIVGIGASTGGPPVIKQILSALPPDFPAPIVIVQHMAQGFIEGFRDWLSDHTSLKVVLAEDGVYPRQGYCYLAPDDHHMVIDRSGRIALTSEPPEHNIRPAVSPLFRSLAMVYGQRAIGILLTGMGRDGAEALKLLKEKGALTIAQDKTTSVVHGMPGEAIRINAAEVVLPDYQIGPYLLDVIKNTRKYSHLSG